MNKYYIDNTDIFTANGITVLKAEGLFDGAPQRITKRTWSDKSGTDVDFDNIRLDETEYTLECLCQAATKQALADQMEAFNHVFKTGLKVFSVRGLYRKAFLVYKEAEITGKYYRGGLGYCYLFTLKLKDANPAAQRWITFTSDNQTSLSIDYTGEPSYIFWGDGTKELLPASGTYSHTYTELTEIDIIIDADGATHLKAPEGDFSAAPLSGQVPLYVQFTPVTRGLVSEVLWNFGDGTTSNKFNPIHIYSAPGKYTVSLKLKNSNGEVTISKYEIIDTTFYNLKLDKSFIPNDINNYPSEIFFSTNGTKMYIGESSTLYSDFYTLYQFTLSTPWNIETATYDNIYFDFNGYYAPKCGLNFTPDGLSIIYISSHNNYIIKVILATAWDISTHGGVNISTILDDTSDIVSLTFSSDGAKLFFGNKTDMNVHWRPLSTPWDINTIGGQGIGLPTSIRSSSNFDVDAIIFDYSGHYLYLLRRESAKGPITKLYLTTAWDLSTAELLWFENHPMSFIYVNEIIKNVFAIAKGNLITSYIFE